MAEQNWKSEEFVEVWNPSLGESSITSMSAKALYNVHSDKGWELYDREAQGFAPFAPKVIKKSRPGQKKTAAKVVDSKQKQAKDSGTSSEEE